MGKIINLILIINALASIILFCVLWFYSTKHKKRRAVLLIPIVLIAALIAYMNIEEINTEKRKTQMDTIEFIDLGNTQ